MCQICHSNRLKLKAWDKKKLRQDTSICCCNFLTKMFTLLHISLDKMVTGSSIVLQKSGFTSLIMLHVFITQCQCIDDIFHCPR